MLYISTRDRTNSFTANRALQEDRAPDGGMFVPFQMPCFSDEQIRKFKDMSFGDAVATILNLFFGTAVGGWDLDFQVGRSPCKLVRMSHRMVIAQLWHNHGADYRHLEQSLYRKIGGKYAGDKDLPNWAGIAVRIAVLFGIYSDFLKQDIDAFDIAVPTGEFSGLIAAWYARKLGLPVGMIICGCNDNGAVWDLIHRGEFNTSTAMIKTKAPELDVACPSAVERLIFDVLGRDETQRYVSICEKKGTFKIPDHDGIRLGDHLFAAVVSGRRMESVISSMYRTNGYLADPYTAVAFGALQDYRARTGESKTTLIMADRSPAHYIKMISGILNCSADTLKKQINTPKE